MTEEPYIGDGEDLPPTEKQLRYVQALCERRGLTVPDLATRLDAHTFIASQRANWLTRTEIRKVACPRCGAPEGRLCRGERKEGRRMNHRERVAEAQRNRDLGAKGDIGVDMGSSEW